MGRIGITQNDVIRAAIALLQRGENPSVRNIRRELGDTGSPNTIQEHLAAWREQLNAESLSALPSSLPQSLVEPLEALFAVAIQEAEKNYQRERQAALTLADAAQHESELWEQRAKMAEQTNVDLGRSIAEQQRQIESLIRDNHELKEHLAAQEAKHDQRQAESTTAQERLIIQLHHEREERRRDRETFETKLSNAEGRIAVEAQRADDQQLHWIRQIDLARTETTDARAQIQSLQRRMDGELLLARKREENAIHKLTQTEQLLQKNVQEIAVLTTTCHQLEKSLDTVNSQLSSERERALLEKSLTWQQAIAHTQAIFNQKDIDDTEKSILLGQLLQQPSLEA